MTLIGRVVVVVVAVQGTSGGRPARAKCPPACVLLLIADGNNPN